MTQLTEIIAEHRFTKAMNARYFHLVKDCAALERFEPQQMIFEEGGIADRFYLIHTGLIALQTFVPSRGVTTVQTLASDEVLGWSWLVPPYRWHFSAVAVKPVEVVSICASMLKARMEENHDFGYAIMIQVGPAMLERLQSTRMRLIEAYGIPS